MIYTNERLFEKLRELIPNLPCHCQSITLAVKAGEEPPTLTLVVYAGQPDARKFSDQLVSERFYLVSEKHWDKARQFIAFSERELEKMS